MRTKMIEQDLVECVIGLGPNLFYNSPMEACLLVTTTNKAEHKKGKILFINAVKEVKQNKTIGILEQKHIDKIFKTYQGFESVDNFANLVDVSDVLERKGNMAINLYVRPDKLSEQSELSLQESYQQWSESSKELKGSMAQLFKVLVKNG